MSDFRFVVSSEEEGQEVRILMRKHFDFSSRLRGRVKREKLLILNGKPARGFEKATTGDVISVDLPAERSHFEPEDIPLDIIYEDDDIMLINKPAGIVVHPTKGHFEGTIANGLSYLMDTRGEHFKVRFVNRLDMDTSGILLVAKNSYAQSDFIKSSDKGLVTKEYRAIVCGNMTEKGGSIDLPIAPPLEGTKTRRISPDGAPSITHYQVLEEFDGYTLLGLVLETGRTHQIRVHLSHIGHPVAGDSLYGGESPELIERQALHAYCLAFPHPTKKEALRFEAPLAVDMLDGINRLRLHSSSSY